MNNFTEYQNDSVNFYKVITWVITQYMLQNTNNLKNLLTFWIIKKEH